MDAVPDRTLKLFKAGADQIPIVAASMITDLRGSTSVCEKIDLLEKGTEY